LQASCGQGVAGLEEGMKAFGTDCRSRMPARLKGLVCATAFCVVVTWIPDAGARQNAAATTGGGNPIQSLPAIVDDRLLDGWKVGIVVADAGSGEVLFARNADAPMTPGSCAKLFTAHAALRYLGPSRTFNTKVVAQRPPEQGVVEGDIGLVGVGDPTLGPEEIRRIAGLVRRSGVQKVAGDLVFDASYFDDEATVPGAGAFPDNGAYNSPVGALSVNRNTVAVIVRPASGPGKPVRVRLDPPTAQITVVNRARTISPGRRPVLHVVPRSPGKLEVRGRMPMDQLEAGYSVPVPDPAALAAEVFDESLRDAGVTVAGGIRPGKVTGNAVELVSWPSPPVSDMVRLINKESSNFAAEQLVKILGAEASGESGSTSDGLAVVVAQAERIGIEPQRLVLRNGSGLDRQARVSARALVRLLSAAWQDFEVRQKLVASLPIAGRDGTLSERMTGTIAAGRLRAKTGTLRGASCLAGYTRNRSGRDLAFAILVNGIDGSPQPAMDFQDRIGVVLTEGTEREKRATPAAPDSRCGQAWRRRPPPAIEAKDIAVNRGNILCARRMYERIVPLVSAGSRKRFGNLVYEGNNPRMRGQRSGNTGLYERTGREVAAAWRRYAAGVRGMFVLRDSLYSQQDHPYLNSPYSPMLPPRWVAAVAHAASLAGNFRVPVLPAVEDDAAWNALAGPAALFGDLPVSRALFEAAVGTGARAGNARATLQTLYRDARALVAVLPRGPGAVARVGAERIAHSDRAYFGDKLRRERIIPILVRNPSPYEVAEGKGLARPGSNIPMELRDAIKRAVNKRRLADGDIALERYDLSNAAERRRAVSVLEGLIPDSDPDGLSTRVWLWVTGKLQPGKGLVGDDARAYIPVFREELRGSDIDMSRVELLSKPAVSLPERGFEEALLRELVDFKELGMPMSVDLPATHPGLRRLLCCRH